MRRATSLGLAAVGVALLVGTPVAWRLSQPAPRVGEVPTLSAATERSGSAPAPDTSRDEPTDAGATATPAWQVGTRDGSTPLASATATAPTVVRIPAIGVDASIVGVGVEDDGSMEVPTDITEAGWYRFGPTPGDVGSAVIAGHVDSRTQGLGAFGRLRELGTDQLVEVVLEDGSTQRFRTVARETYEKTAIPLGEVFSRSGPSRLVLVTCGGEFDSATRHYRSNVVVYAVPADD